MRISNIRSVLLCGVALVMPATAFAQTAANNTDGGIAEIVVTARKTSENLQTVPVAVTALDTAALESRQIASISDLQQVAPGLNSQGGGPGPSSVIYLAIRGNSQTGAGSTSDSAVGVYVDDVYLARPISSNLGLLDMASAEVLRGTQGTLFGRNTTGGALNLTTVQPGNEFTGYVRAGYGNYNAYSVEAAVTAPITDDGVGVRLAGRIAGRDGYGFNPLTGRDIGKVDSDVSLRGTFRYAPSASSFSATISGDYVKSKDRGSMIALKAVNPASLFGALFPNVNPAQYVQTPQNFYQNFGLVNRAAASVNPDTLNKINTPYNRTEAWGVRGTLGYELGDVSLKSITAYRKSDAGNSQDLDGTPAGGVAFATRYLQRQFSEELQISGKTGKLEWIVGGIYFEESGTEESNSFSVYGATVPQGFFLPPGISLLFPNGIPGALTVGDVSASGRNFGNFKAQSTGLFAQANYHLTDALRVTGGIRYTWDKRNLDRHLFNNIQSVPEAIIPPPFVVQPATCISGATAGQANTTLATCVDNNAGKYSYPAWTFGFDYQVNDDLLLYAKTGGAALSGGFNARQVPATVSVGYNPEKVKDVEVGMKVDLLDKRLRVNLAGFKVWRNGAQNIISAFVANRSTQYTTNQGNIRGYGFEAEITAQPWHGMELTSAISNFNSKYAAGSFIEGGSNGLVDRSGERVVRAPKWTVNVGATQSFDVGSAKVSLHGDYAYTSSVAFSQMTADLTNPALTAAQRSAALATAALVNELDTQKAYGLFNLRASVELENGLELAVWGRNVTGKKYNVNFADFYTSLGFVNAYPGNPATWGGTVTFRF